MRKVLIVEDEEVIRAFVLLNLQRAGYNASVAGSGEEGLAVLSAERDFDIVLLDVMLPGIDGFETCRRIRETFNDIGIILLTAKVQETDKVDGFTSGADDYVTKPFSPVELLARVDALHRRVTGPKAAEAVPVSIESGNFTLDTKRRVIYKNGEPIELTSVEYQIMECFFTNIDIPIERVKILRRVWGQGYNGDDKIIDVNIRRLRMKLEDNPSNPRNIQTVWGFGYAWKP